MRRAAAVLFASLLAASAAAHTRSVSYSSWTLDGEGARVEVRLALLELTRLGIEPGDVASDGPVARYLAEHLTLERGGARCAPDGELTAKSAPKGQVRFQWRVACPASGPARIESAILLEQAPSHLHFARVATPGGALERLLSEADPRWALPEANAGAPDAAPEGSALSDYVRLGVVHILSGWDHLAFVLALLLLASRFSEVASLVTAFTLAHSITLGLGVLGVVHPQSAAVEALIGYSIALVAAENAWLLAGRGAAVPLVATLGLCAMALLARAGIGAVSEPALLGLALFSACHFGLLDRVSRPARLRAAVAFAFGLVHGFGFAGVLGEMELPPGRVAPALFGFNVGVELGQLGVVALVWPLLRALEARRPPVHRQVAEVLSAGICGLGLYWFLTRALG
jgi:hypothetical protein